MITKEPFAFCKSCYRLFWRTAIGAGRPAILCPECKPGWTRARASERQRKHRNRTATLKGEDSAGLRDWVPSVLIIAAIQTPHFDRLIKELETGDYESG